MAEDRARRGLARLDELDDYRVAKGDPDVRGWKVVGSDGGRIGTVAHLIADTTQMRVRYLEVELDSELRPGSDDRTVLLPIGAVRLDDTRDNVIVDSMSSIDFGSFPSRTAGGAIDREYETSVSDRFRGGAPAEPAGATDAATARDDFYAGEHFDDTRYQQGIAARRLTLSQGRLGPDRDREAGADDRR